MPNELPIRCHPVHGVKERLDLPTIVFVTVCTKDRRPWLATAENHSLLRETWKDAQAWRVGRYVLMPDHLHLFASPGSPELPLDNWVRYWKSLFTRTHRDKAHLWQTDHWDRRLRGGDNYFEKWEYVRDNPVRRGLVLHAADWPFQGEIFNLEW